MTKRWGGLLLVAVAGAAGAIYFVKKRSPDEGRSGAVQRAGSAQNAPKSPTATAPKALARAQITVTSANGALANATVRLSHEGEVTLVQTGTDGVARADGLEPGEWSISASAEGHEPAAATARELRGGETAKIDIKLTAGGRVLTGLVTDASGGPIAGARIDAGKLDTMARPADAVASTATGADGRYELQVAEGPLLVAASEPSYSPQSRFVDVGPAGATADFQLVPGGVIEGIVRDEKTREPVAGAQVNAQRDQSATLFGERARHRAISGADGRFRMAGLRPGAWDLDARAPKRTSQSPTLVGIGVAEQVTDVEILIGASPVIRGVVVDDQGTPVPEIDVTAFGAGGSGERATSDAKGAFEIEGLVPGNYMLLARSDAYLPAGTTKVTLESKDLDNVKVTVTKGLRVKGHVEPRQICDVELEMSEATMMGGPFQMFTPQATGADGEFDLGPAKPGAYDIRARCQSGAQGSVAVKTPTAADVVVEVKPGASIAGKVVDGKGQPVVGVAVSAAQVGGTERTMIVNGMMVSGVQARTNGKGEFELRGLGAGQYRLRVLDRGRPLPTKTETKVTLGATEKKTGITLAIERPDGVIRGVVTGPDGKPLADAWVSIHQSMEDLLGGIDAARGESRMVAIESRDDGSGESADYAPVLTDASGKFELTNLPRVPWTVIAEAQAGKVRGRATKVVPDASITIQAVGLTELKGTVRVSGGGAPSSFAVELDGPTRAQRAFATADGSFSFSRVDPGDYTVTVTSTAGNGKAAVKVQAGQAATVTIDLAANATVIGKLVDAAGKPLGGLPVAVVPDANDGSLRIELSGPPPTSNPDGTFRIEAKAGLGAVLVLVPPRPVSKRGLRLEAGKTFDAGTITVETGAQPKP